MSKLIKVESSEAMTKIRFNITPTFGQITKIDNALRKIDYVKDYFWSSNLLYVKYKEDVKSKNISSIIEELL